MGTIVRFFQDGGAFMYPILFVFAFGIAIAVERWMYLTMSGASNRALWKKIVPYLKAGNFQEAAQVTTKSKAAIASILTYGLYRVKSARRRDDIEKAMEETKEKLQSDDLKAIKASNEKLQEAVQAAAGEVYKATTESEQADQTEGDGDSEKKEEGPVVDAEVVG